MRQVVAVLVGALLAAAGAVVLGEYDLRGTTVLLGFPLYGVAVAELTVAIARRPGWAVLAALVAVVGGGLSLALWISFGHFRNVEPPVLSWVMVAVAAVAAVAWASSGRRRVSTLTPEVPS